MTSAAADVRPSTTPPGSGDAALLRLLLKLFLLYALAGCLAVLIRAELVRWGLTIYDHGYPVIRRALGFHAGLAFAAIAALAWLRRARAPLDADSPSAAASSRDSAGGLQRSARLICRVLLALGPMVALISVDLFLSIDFAPPPVSEHAIFMRDPKLIWRLEPGAKGTRGGYPVEINAQGLRGPAVACRHPSDEYRILFLGDSTTFGYGLGWADTFVARTQRLVAQVNNRRLTVINAGVAGYTTWQEFGFLEDEGVRYSPDLVVLGFCPNDLTDYERPFRVYAGGRWLKYSGIFRALQHWRHGPRGEWVQGRRRDFTPPIIEDLFATEESEATRAGWSESLNHIEKTRAFCAERGMAFVLLCIPAQAQVLDPARFDDRPQRRLAAFTAERGIRFLDPLPRMLARGPEDARACYLDNWHLSAQGHAVVAGLLGEALAAPNESP